MAACGALKSGGGRSESEAGRVIVRDKNDMLNLLSSADAMKRGPLRF